MSLSKAIYKILSSDTDLVAEVSTRIFPSVVPQNIDYPSIKYDINSIDPMYSKNRRHQKTEAHIVIGVHGKTYSDVQNVSDIVIATLEKYKNAIDFASPPTGLSGTPNTAGCSIVEGYWIQEVFFDNSFDLFDEKLRVFEKYIEFDVRFIVNPASMGAYGWFPANMKGLLSTSDTANTPPTSDGDSIKMFYDGSGATTLNLTYSGTTPKFYDDGYLSFPQATVSGSALGSASSVEFTSGTTMFFIFKEAVTAADFTIYLMCEDADNYIKLRSTGSSFLIEMNINGNEIDLLNTAEGIDFTNKTYLAVSWGTSSDETGEWEVIDPEDSTYYNKNLYNSYSETDAGNFKFQYLGAISALSDADSSLRLYESVIFNKKLTFGGGQYNRIKDYLLNKHSL